MCGFAGFTGAHKLYQEYDFSIASAMGESIIHRGPDDQGVWKDQTFPLLFIHRRLSILDPSPAGRQPMVSGNRRYVIAFNGEIYNHRELRESILKETDKQWQGSSDTESLLAAIECFGVNETLSKIQGMFSFSLWDIHRKILYLARDRMGEKPLYYGWQNGSFLFGSELKALKAHPDFSGDINRDAIALQMRHNYIPAPYSIYKGIYKLQAGHLLRLDANDIQKKNQPATSPYWSLVNVAKQGVMRPYEGNPQQAVEKLDVLLRDAINKQMMADVPLGAFLSGGVDSSTVVALMQAQSSRPVKTFSIGFHEAGYNEAVHARAVASHLGTEHTELYVTSEQAIAVIPDLPFIYDEPFSDSSQIPTLLVSQLAKQHVTVSLSGDGGDELFCGYNRYQMTHHLWQRLMLLPASLRTTLASLLTKPSPDAWNKVARYVPGLSGEKNIGDKVHKGAGVLGVKTLNELYLGLVSHWTNPSDIVIGGNELPTILTGHRPKVTGLDSIQQMMLPDSLMYLPDDILVKVDRASMASSLESRVPLLDHRIVEFAWQLPQSLKLRDGQSKWLLRQVLYRYVPKTLIERPKMGFGVPIGEWLRGALREWAETLLSESRLRQEGYFNPAPIRQKWKEHLSGKRNWQYLLWDILMFQAWLYKN